MSRDMDREAFYKSFEQTPGDLSAYGAFADFLDEEGWHKLAHAFRWMCKRGIWPHMRTNYVSANPRSDKRFGRKVPKSARWAWYRGSSWRGDLLVTTVFPPAPRQVHGLPPLVLFGEQKIFPTHQAAVMWLACALDVLRQDYDVEPPKLKEL
jgi:hypothetical protein